MQSLWYDHYSGAVYPLDLHAEPACQGKVKLMSLANTCAHYIIKDASLTKKVASIVSPNVVCILMQEAVSLGRDRAVDVLLKKWPMKTLSLRSLCPNLFTSALPLFNVPHLRDVSRQGLRITTCLAHQFIENLKKQEPMKLQYIDLTGFPLAEIVLHFAAAHTMLSHKESQQNMWTERYNDVAKKMKSSELDMIVESLPGDKYYMKLDAFISSIASHSELCKALALSAFEPCKLKLILEKIDATCLGQEKVSILLRQLDYEHLKGLRLKYNSLSCEDFIQLAPVIENFKNITSLDLSCNSIYVYTHDRACTAMTKLLSGLPNLSRLDLSNNRIKTRLRRILSDVAKPLHYLRLVACGLTVSDLCYLSVSHHLTAIQELDLSENSLTASCQHMCKILLSSRESLLTLELEDCVLADENIAMIQPYLSQLQHIIFINIAENALSTRQLVSTTQGLSTVAPLKYIKFSYPKECYDDEEAEETRKQYTEQLLHDSSKRPLHYGDQQLIPVGLERSMRVDDRLFHGHDPDV